MDKYTDEIGKYHGLKIERFTNQLRDVLNIPDSVEDDEERYRHYLEWCELSQTPLYKALT